MARCRHYEVCEREHRTIPQSGRCILHSRDPYKGAGEFRKALKKHREVIGDVFQQMYFPEDEADFSGDTFGTRVDFSNAVFEGAADFSNVTFEGVVQFFGAIFEAEADFSSATFRKEADFMWATFGQDTFRAKANFRIATFKARALFSSAIFKARALFTNATFEKVVLFPGATFEKEANFKWVTFGEGATFGKEAPRPDVMFGGETIFDQCSANGRLTFAGQSEEKRIFRDCQLSFMNVTRGADSQIHFRYADLSQCHFMRTNLRTVDFNGVRWPKVKTEWFGRAGIYDEIQGGPPDPERANAQASGERRWYEIERLYRQLKKNYEERGDYPRAGDFHIGEKQARRKNPETKWGPWGLLTIYRALSKYGERALPAFLWLLSVVLGCALLYLLVGIPPVGTETPLSISRGTDWVRALLYSTRVSMLAEGTEGIKHLGAQATQVLQSILSPVLVALFALALRQQLKR